MFGSVHSSVERNQLINYKIAVDVNEVVGNNTETWKIAKTTKLCSQQTQKKKKKNKKIPKPKSIEFDYLHFAFGFANSMDSDWTELISDE